MRFETNLLMNFDEDVDFVNPYKIAFSQKCNMFRDPSENVILE